MKKQALPLSLSFFVLMLALLPGCVKDQCSATITYTKYTPVTMSVDALRSSFQVQSGRSVEQNKKIYVYGDYLLVNEVAKGIHVINNENPGQPISVAFLNIPGNHDMAVRNDVLYADNAMDLLVIDLSNPSSPQLINTVKDVIPGYNPANGMVTVNMLEEEITEDATCNNNGTWTTRSGGVIVEDAGTWRATSMSNSGNTGTTGKGGSMARFTIVKDYLYIIDRNSLVPLSLSAPTSPAAQPKVNVGGNIETIYPFQDKLFIGSMNGLFIYTLDNPAIPQKAGQFSHATSCDPVVVEGNTAYVTLRGGTPCNGFSNQLDVLDVSDIYNPKLIKTYPMTNPFGLGIDNNTLFICDGLDGLKVYNAEDRDKIDRNKLGHYKGMTTYDVIPHENVLILSADDGIYQYDYSNPKELKQLSKISVVRR